MRGAVLEVIGQEYLLSRTQRGMSSGELLQDIGAVAFVLDHPADAFDLPANPGKPVREIGLCGFSDTQRVRRAS
jgi:hypothetical protein